MIRFFQWFTKITGWLPFFVLFRMKVYYENKSVQSRKIKGKAIVISNHTSIYDFALFLFVFRRTLRCLTAEILYTKAKIFGWFLKRLGCIYVNRNTHSFKFLNESLDILSKGGVIEIYPESRIPEKDEEKPQIFKPSAAYLALTSDAPVIPCYTNGSYFNFKKRAKVIIGEPMMLKDYIDPNLSEKENLIKISEDMRQKVIELGRMLDEKEK